MTLAVAALASCSKVEPIEPGYKSAIGFGKSFVENSTKALIDEAALKTENFAVWGTEKQGDNAAVSIFTAEEITWSTTNSAWEYDSTVRYWHKGHVYNFAAVAPFAHGLADMALVNGLPNTATYTLVNTGIDNQVDLLYAKSNPNITPDRDDFADKVNFTFDHQLAKVQFHITNSYSAGYTVQIENLKIKASKSATVTFPGAWSAHAALADDFKLPFTIANIAKGATGVSEQSLIIPKGTDFDYTVEGTAKVIMNGTTVVKTIPLDYTIDSELKAGYHYNITADVKPGMPIQFNVTGINDFKPGSNVAM